MSNQTYCDKITEQENDLKSYYVLKVAFQTMKERCQQLQARLAAVEEENVGLRHQFGRDYFATITEIQSRDENNIIQSQQKKIKELMKQKSQLVHHILMASTENQQLWKRLAQLTQINTFFDNQLMKIPDTLKELPQSEILSTLTCSIKEIPELLKNDENTKSSSLDIEERKHSLEEISLQLIDNVLLEKTESEQQYTQITELQNNIKMNFKNIGFGYPGESSTHSLDQLKNHDNKLTQLKGALLTQQNKLQSVLKNLIKMKKSEVRLNCSKSTRKFICQSGAQVHLDCNAKKNEVQIDFCSSALLPNRKNTTSGDENICPLCGIVYEKSVPFNLFHEHVINHFISEITNESEMIT